MNKKLNTFFNVQFDNLRDAPSKLSHRDELWRAPAGEEREKRTNERKKNIPRKEAINHRRIILERLRHYKNNARALSLSLFPFKTINGNRPIFIPYTHAHTHERVEILLYIGCIIRAHTLPETTRRNTRTRCDKFENHSNQSVAAAAVDDGEGAVRD